MTWTPTETPSSVPSSTPTATPTETPAACPPIRVSAAYPNPVFDAETLVRVELSSPCPETVTWKIVTVAYRVVAVGQTDIYGTKTIGWDQRDAQGMPVANGLYFFLLSEAGKTTHVIQILVLR